MNNEIKLILEGVKKGDQIGGPYELSKILAKSLQANNGFNKDDLTKRYLEWWKEDAFDTGPTYASVFTNILKGYDHEKAVLKTHQDFDENTAGCGPAHRCMPLAGFIKIPAEELIGLARLEAKITHYHEDAGNGSAIVNLLCRNLLEGNNFDNACVKLSQNKEFIESWKKVENAKLSPDGYVYNVIHSAIHFIKNKNTLDLRGYVGIALLGRTSTWTRAK